MDEEISEYIQYILSLVEIRRPKMPKFDLSAYTDIEYTIAINELMEDFKFTNLDLLQ